MLRNPGLWGHALRPLLLNEVLSLNAQESSIVHRTRRPYPILNEVLSLNAQEYTALIGASMPALILNEVLSLNAQEFGTYYATCPYCGPQ